MTDEEAYEIASRGVAETRKLKSKSCPRCGMRLDDPRHEVIDNGNGCRAKTEHG